MRNVVIALATVVAVSSRAAAASCTPTGFVRDGINLTAALVNPSGTVTGAVDATGCNIAVYYDAGASGVVKNADVFGANYFGVLSTATMAQSASTSWPVRFTTSARRRTTARSMASPFTIEDFPHPSSPDASRATRFRGIRKAAS